MAYTQRSSKNPIHFLRKLDAFPKVPEDCQQSTRIGGTLSVISRFIIIYFIFYEVSYYMESHLKFEFKPDTDMDEQMQLHFDITVPMMCPIIDAYVMDATGDSAIAYGRLEKIPTTWEMCTEQKQFFEYTQQINTYLREKYHSLTEVIFNDMLDENSLIPFDSPVCSVEPTGSPDACRIMGELKMSKVAGSFLIGSEHLHTNRCPDEIFANFSHRINRFSFGTKDSGLVQPLEGDDMVFYDGSTKAQYFIDIVPTEIHSFLSTIKTYQYAVKEKFRALYPKDGPLELHGIFFHYDLSALKVIVTLDREDLITFVVRLCSVIAGIIVLSGFLNSLLQLIVGCFARKKYQLPQSF